MKYLFVFAILLLTLAIVNADKIIVLKKGEVIETGTHTELVRLNGAYKKLVERQMMTEELGEKVTK